MRTNTFGMCGQNVYRSVSPLYTKKTSATPEKSAGDLKKDAREVKKIFRELQRDKYDTATKHIGSSHIDSIQQYSNSIRTKRQGAKDTANSIKKIKYQFKNISSKILRSKTSAAARQAEGQARREVIRLKNERKNPDVDLEELEAAIAHAKAMERVAKKKVKHLEEEEMAKASGGPCQGDGITEEEQEKKIVPEDDNAEELLEEYDAEELLNDLEESEWNEEIDSSYDMEAILQMIVEGMDEFTSEMSESIADLMEEMGLDELTDELVAAKGDMDPDDLKMMKIKHRNKEMKEIVKADADYLKAVFDHLEKMKGTVPAPVGSNGSQPMPGVAANIPMGIVTGTADVATPIVDIAL